MVYSISILTGIVGIMIKNEFGNGWVSANRAQSH